jgi:hypothetical protein
MSAEALRDPFLSGWSLLETLPLNTRMAPPLTLSKESQKG